MKVSELKVELISDRHINAYGNSLRGMISNIFSQNTLFSNHDIKGLPVYTYPRMLYKIRNNTGILIGIEEGAEALAEAYQKLEGLELKGEAYPIIEKRTFHRDVSFGLLESQAKYKFDSPWLAFNENNYRKYLHSSKSQQKALLRKILVGNLLSVAKSFCEVVTGKVVVEDLNLRIAETYLKGNPMLGFLGTFSVNFEIPDLWGIGKSVSRGFGTVKKVEE